MGSRYVETTAVRRRQIEAQWSRALKAMRAAEALQKQQLWEDAVSRAYYAVMHAARAALLVHDVTAQSHTAIRRRFGQVLVASGEVDKEWAIVLAREQDQRMAADYDVDVQLDPELVADLIRDAQRFIRHMEAYLVSKGVEGL